MIEALVVDRQEVHVVSVAGQGPAGAQGIPGPAGAVVLSYVAGTALSGHRAVVIDSNYQAVYADNQTLAHAARVLGVSLNAAAPLEAVNVQTSNEVQEPTWSWTPGGQIYLGATGTLTQTVPAAPAVFILAVGFATAADRMVVSIEMPLILA